MEETIVSLSSPVFIGCFAVFRGVRSFRLSRLARSAARCQPSVDPRAIYRRIAKMPADRHLQYVSGIVSALGDGIDSFSRNVSHPPPYRAAIRTESQPNRLAAGNFPR